MLLFVCLFACLFVCKITQKNCSTDFFYKIRWKGGTRATEETVRFFGYPDQVTLGFGLGLG